MSAEPDNPIERQLRDYARKRREQPGVPAGLHPANRRLLQAELQKSYSQIKQSKPKPNNHLAWWFRWQGLASLGAAVVLFCLGIVWWATQESRSVMEMARSPSPVDQKFVAGDHRENAPVPRKDPSSAASFAKNAATVTPPTPSLTPVTEERLRLSERNWKAETPRPGGVPEVLFNVQSSVEPAQDRDQDAAVRGLSSPALAIPPVTSPVLLSDLSTALVTANFQTNSAPTPAVETLFFKQLLPDAAAAKGELGQRSFLTLQRTQRVFSDNRLLNEFQLQHSNGQITIRDQDGSEYRGSLAAMPGQNQPVSAAAATVSRSAAGVATPATPQSGIVSPYRFQVRGTNRSLQQLLVLDGQLRAISVNYNQNQIPPSRAQTVPEAQLQESRQTVGTSVAAWEFQSSVTVGTQQPVSMNAVQVPARPAAAPAAPTPRAKP